MTNNPTPVDVAALGYDAYELNRELDKVKAQVFLGKHAAFLGSLLSTIDLVWSDSVPTAATNSLIIWWNPEFFQKASMNLRKAVLVHELWHIGRLHMLRFGARDLDDWNKACYIIINNDMTNEGFIFEGFKPWIDHAYDGMAEEELYELIHAGKITMPPCPWGDSGDMLPLTGNEQHTVVNNVVTAVHQATLANEAGSLPGAVTEVLNKFLSPVVAWQQLLYRFFDDLQDTRYTWASPNRRYTDMYLPSRVKDDGRLNHLIYFLDVSGSISTHQADRFNSEVAYIKQEFNPRKLTLVQFDTIIQKVDEFHEDDPFTMLEIVGRGGTHLECVRNYIDQHQPDAAIIFSDLYCGKMARPTYDVPVIWIVINNRQSEVDFGKVVHITA